ncbi:MAG: hypothetical protein JW881_18605 [Spirochaetales bacterium]|nr:hypothetical protein [Spirochaetales bacterium]
MLKKTFFNFWDNLFHIFFCNVGFILIIILSSGLYFILGLVPHMTITIQSILFISLTIILLFIYSGAVHGVLRDIADYKSPGFRDFFVYLKESVLISLGYALGMIAITVLLVLSILLYSYMDFFFKFSAQIILVFLLITLFTAGQYFFPIFYGLDKRFLKILKKMFIIFFDNVLFSFILLIFTPIIMIISFFTLFIIPGPAFILLLHNVALKLRLYKYDYLEKNPEAKKIPWEQLLIDDREKVGTRTLKGMIFPWKE